MDDSITAWDYPHVPDGVIICNEYTARLIAHNLGVEVEVVDRSED